MKAFLVAVLKFIVVVTAVITGIMFLVYLFVVDLPSGDYRGLVLLAFAGLITTAVVITKKQRRSHASTD